MVVTKSQSPHKTWTRGESPSIPEHWFVPSYPTFEDTLSLPSVTMGNPKKAESFKDRLKARLRLQYYVMTDAYLMNLHINWSLFHFLSLPFQVDWESQRVVAVTKGFRRFVLRCTWIFQASRSFWFLFFMCLRAAGVMRKGAYGIEEKMSDYGWLGPILCTVFFRFEFNRKKKETAYVLNTAYDLEKKAISEGHNALYKSGFQGLMFQMFILSATGAYTLIPIAAGLFSYNQPCMDIFTSAQILDCPTQDHQPQKPWEQWFILFHAFGETSMWYQLMTVGVMANPCTVHFLTLDLRMLNKFASRTKTNNVDMKTVHHWRTYQVYATLLNYVISHVVTPTIITAWSLILTVGSYACLMLWGVIEVYLYLLHGLFVVNGLIAIYTEMKTAGDVYDTSVDALKRWRAGVLNSRNHKLSIRYLRSFPPMKVRIGPTNYFESDTPLNVSSLVVDQLINVIVATKK